MTERFGQHYPQQTASQQGSAPPSVEIKSITWNKDTHGLFDYESNSCHHGKFKVRAGDISIFRKHQGMLQGYVDPYVVVADNEILETKYIAENSALISKLKVKRDSMHSAHLELQANPQHLIPKDHDRLKTEQSGAGSSEDIYLVVRSLKNKDGSSRGHPISVGERIRLGRVTYDVIEMKTAGNTVYSQASPDSILRKTEKPEQLRQAKPGACCKICMDDTDTPQNFLMAPCRCTGSCQYVHFRCLSIWLESKVKKSVVGVTVCYNFSKFECEICKTPLPLFVEKNGRHDLLKIDRPVGNYLMLEETDKQNKNVTVIDNMPEGGIKLGRNHECHIRINDISVSRVHSIIKLIGGRFVIFDNESKFGTLIKVRQDIPIDFDKKAFQVGRTVLTIKLKPNTSLMEVEEAQ